MTAGLTKLPSGDIELSITIPWEHVSSLYNDVVSELAATLEINGFRKGKAPRNLIERKLDKSKTYEEVIKRLIPRAYAEAVKQQNLNPIVTPDVHLKEAQEGKNWVIVCRTCEKPPAILGDYRKAVREMKASKRARLWVPGQDQKSDEKSRTSDQKPTLDELITAFLSAVTITIPAILITQEVNRQLASLIDQTKKLGLTVEQYLASTGKTVESLRAEHEEQARKMLSLEFSLEAVADRERITVADADVDTVLKTAKSQEERKALEAERYYLSSLIRRQKVIDFLAAL